MYWNFLREWLLQWTNPDNTFTFDSACYKYFEVRVLLHWKSLKIKQETRKKPTSGSKSSDERIWFDNFLGGCN